MTSEAAAAAHRAAWSRAAALRADRGVHSPATLDHGLDVTCAGEGSGRLHHATSSASAAPSPPSRRDHKDIDYDSGRMTQGT